MEQGNLPSGQQENTNREKQAQAGNAPKIEQEKIPGKNDTDTEPDEFIAPNADTDQPMDGKGIVNDAVLGGEDHPKEDVDRKRADKK